MSSSTEICNLALVHIGVGKSIASLTERSAEALVCNRVYEIARDLVLGDFPWPFAKKLATLALLRENTADTDEWRFTYTYPTDALAIIRILSGTRNDTRQSRVPIKFYAGSSTQEIFTDMEDAIAEYTSKVTDPARFSQDFTMALSYKIGQLIAPALTAGDPFKMGDKAESNYIKSIRNAQAKATNEEQPEEDPESELIRARDA